MDKKKLDSCCLKLKNADHQTRLSFIYQWIMTKHLKLDEFAAILEWIDENPSHSNSSDNGRQVQVEKPFGEPIALVVDRGA